MDAELRNGPSSEKDITGGGQDLDSGSEHAVKRAKVSESQKDNAHVAQRLVDQLQLLQQLQQLQQLHSKPPCKPQAVKTIDPGLNGEANQQRAKRAAEQQAQIAEQMCAEMDVLTSGQAFSSDATPFLLRSKKSLRKTNPPSQGARLSDSTPSIFPSEPSGHTPAQETCLSGANPPIPHTKTCKFAECIQAPAPEVEGEESSPYCPAHREQIMNSYLSRGCLHPGCVSQPFYPKVGGRLPKYCEAHKPAHIPSLKHPRCQFQGCLVRPSFAVEGSGKPQFCHAHKDPWMADTSNKSKSCQTPGCNVAPSFAHEGRAIFCGTHKEPGMRNVSHKPCREPGCITRPSYAAEGVPQPEYCATHRAEGMVHVRNQRDAMKQVMAVREARQAAGRL